MSKLCECGCGTKIAKDRRWATGHNRTGFRKPRVVVGKCSNCGTEIIATAIEAIRRKERSPRLMYCSWKCRDEYRREHKGKWHPQYKRKKQRCKICRRTFETIPSRFKRDADVYCSMECGREGRRRKLVKRHYERGRGKSIWSLKGQAKERDNYRCRICGFREALHVHHIYPKLDDLDFMITLCPNHHALVHANYFTQQQLIEILAEPLPQRELKLTRKTHALYYRRELK